MARHPYTFKDGERIFFARGAFDDWCVYRQVPGQKPTAPKDLDYFSELLRLGLTYGCERIYRNFIALYDLTGKEPSSQALRLLGEQALTLAEEDRLAYGKVMITLYYAMLAEQNREPEARWPLKKKVKKIGVFQVLLKRMPQRAERFLAAPPPG